ncbi:MAG: trypsin-like peptidase domain-containing protein [Chitinophagaceae bacterium]|nr:trypsin-like peptidase domain-containing protein [Chitinophagaceae bacterium]
MNDNKILDAVERYIRGEMKPDERLQFENLRKTNSEIDELVVEHTLFLQQLNHFGERRSLRHTLNEIHVDLTESGKIDSMKLKGKAKVVYIWNRYKRVTAIAASIAGITAITISALLWSIAGKSPKNGDFEILSDQIRKLENRSNKTETELKNVKTTITRSQNTYTAGGTGFVIDVKGYLVTNAHVVASASNIAVQNNRGDYVATVVYIDRAKDIAILKIVDENFKPYTSIPYAISKNSGQLAENIFTLGYPRNEIVYGQGYLSAKTGYNGDTLSCQIDIAANHGNSGSPILNKNGEVIGILNGRQANTVGFAFAIHGKNIFSALEDLKKDSSYQKVKLNTRSSISGMDRTEQVKRVQDYIYMVKVN